MRVGFVGEKELIASNPCSAGDALCLARTFVVQAVSSLSALLFGSK